MLNELWLDTDPGFYDWMAWALLEADPAVRLHGVSVVAGNAPLPQVLANARRIHALRGWRTPLFAGADKPLMQPQVTAQDALGVQGLRSTGAALPGAESPLAAAHGVDATIETVTLLNDLCFFAPSALASESFAWRADDDSQVKANFTNGPRIVQATLVFGVDGDLVNFLSEDRSAVQPDRWFKHVRSSAPMRE
jgi:inosine-uridine nucleoside N-ribohydrolase